MQVTFSYICYCTCALHNIEISGYHCYYFFRKYRHRNAKRNSGGIVFYIRNYSIKYEIYVVTNSNDTIIWLERINSSLISNVIYIIILVVCVLFPV